LAWEAAAHAAAGQLSEAETRYAEVLRSAPDLLEARYNRAAVLARMGRYEEAAAELRVVMGEGGASPQQVLRDPDFAEALGRPAFAFLPRTALRVALDPLPESVFWGSEVPVRLTVLGAAEAITVEGAEVRGPARLISATRDTTPSTDGEADVFVFTLRVEGEGTIEVGPFTVGSAGESVVLSPRSVQAAAPADKAADPGVQERLRWPADVVTDLDDGDALWTDAYVWVRGRVADRFEVTPERLWTVRYERRKRGQPVWQVNRYDAPLPSRVALIRGGEQVMEQTRP
jgi:hypothetical protein